MEDYKSPRFLKTEEDVWYWNRLWADYMLKTYGDGNAEVQMVDWNPVFGYRKWWMPL